MKFKVGYICNNPSVAALFGYDYCFIVKFLKKTVRLRTNNGEEVDLTKNLPLYYDVMTDIFAE